jgi:hypothetical protein
MLRPRAAIVVIAFAAATPAQTLQPPFDTAYSVTNLGLVPGVPSLYGGLLFKAGDPSRLLIIGSPDSASGAIYEAQVVRDSTGHITGFSGTATLSASAPFIDDGLQYGPGGVLFFTTYPTNTLGQLRPGSTVPDRTTALAAYGITGSVGALGFVPPGHPNAGELKLASYDTSVWIGFTTTADAVGTYDIAVADGPVSVQGGPEGILYVPPGSNLLADNQYVLVTEFAANSIAVYPIDAQGNPVRTGRLPFLANIAGPEGAATDPITGDLVFGLYAGGIVSVHGFGVCGSCTNYGSGIAGSGGAPHIAGVGCAGRGQTASVRVSNGHAVAPGVLIVGLREQTVPVAGGALLTTVRTWAFHSLDSVGAWTWSGAVPSNPALSGLSVFFQSFYLDGTAVSGVSATEGLHMVVR